MAFAPAGKTPAQLQAQLDTCMPAANQVGLGIFLVDLVTAFNGLVTQHNALLAHLDVADVANIGTANAATYSGAPAPTLGSL